MLKQRLMNGNNGINQKKSELNIEYDSVAYFSERKVALIAFCLSLFVLTTKTVVNNRECIRNSLWSTNYKYLETVLSNQEIVGYYINEVTFKTSKLWMPLISGLFMTGFTWLIVYFDSSEPGVHPPTPFSPIRNKSKENGGSTFHSGYLIAIANGIMVFILMFLNNNLLT